MSCQTTNMFQAGELFQDWKSVYVDLDSTKDWKLNQEWKPNQEYKQSGESVFGDTQCDHYTLNKCSKITHGPPGLEQYNAGKNNNLYPSECNVSVFHSFQPCFDVPMKTHDGSFINEQKHDYMPKQTNRYRTPPKSRESEKKSSTPPRKNSPGHNIKPKKDTSFMQEKIKNFSSRLKTGDFVSYEDLKIHSCHTQTDTNPDNICNHANQANNLSYEPLCRSISEFIVMNQHKIKTNFIFPYHIYENSVCSTSSNQFENSCLFGNKKITINKFEKIECKDCNECLTCKENNGKISEKLYDFILKIDTYSKSKSKQELIDEFSSITNKDDQKKTYCQKYCRFKKIIIEDGIDCESLTLKLNDNGFIKRIKVDYRHKNDTINSHPLGKIIFPDTPEGKMIHFIESIAVQMT